MVTKQEPAEANNPSPEQLSQWGKSAGRGRADGTTSAERELVGLDRRLGTIILMPLAVGMGAFVGLLIWFVIAAGDKYPVRGLGELLAYGFVMSILGAVGGLIFWVAVAVAVVRKYRGSVGWGFYLMLLAILLGSPVLGWRLTEVICPYVPLWQRAPICAAVRMQPHGGAVLAWVIAAVGVIVADWLRTGPGRMPEDEQE